MAQLMVDKGGLVAHLMKKYAEQLGRMSDEELLKEFKRLEKFWDLKLTK